MEGAELFSWRADGLPQSALRLTRCVALTLIANLWPRLVDVRTDALSDGRGECQREGESRMNMEQQIASGNECNCILSGWLSWKSLSPLFARVRSISVDFRKFRGRFSVAGGLLLLLLLKNEGGGYRKKSRMPFNRFNTCCFQGCPLVWSKARAAVALCC